MNPQTLLGNRYEVLEKLGQGGMGEVYKGLDTRTESFVAIKQLRGSIANDETIIERFRREGQALSDLNHPNIVKMLDMIQQGETYFLVTEYIEGGDLAELLQQVGKLPVNESLKMGLELADALSRAHHLGIIHRDIKPANVLIAKDGSPRLTDFGVAHMASQERLTGTGIAIGTLDYLPPEAVEGEAVDTRADLWSFGVMLFEMLTGKRPFTGATTISLLSNILQADVDDIREYCPEASAELNDLIHQMLQKDRNNRIRSARQVGASLEAILAGDDSALRSLQNPAKPITKPLADLPTTPGIPIRANLPSTVASETAPKSRNWLPWIVVAVLILIAVTADLRFGLILFSAPELTITPSPELTITPSPEPTATEAPIVGDAPDGYHWLNVDELRFLLPISWVYVPPMMFDNFLSDIDSNDAGIEALMALFEQQRAYGMYVDFTTLVSVVVMVEDTGIVLPDAILQERSEALATAGETMPLEEIGSLDLSFGRAFFVGNELPATESNTIANRQEGYYFYRGTTLYTLAFSEESEQFEGIREIINTVLASLNIAGETTVEATTEATEVAPNGYKWIMVADARFLVPTVWTSIALDSVLEIGQNFFGDEFSTSYIQGYISRQTVLASYVNLLDFSGALIMVEDTGFVLPNDVLIQRYQELADNTGVNFTVRPNLIETHLGQAIHAVGVMEIIGSDEQQTYLELYGVYYGTKLYTFGVSGRGDDFEANREIYQVFYESIEFTTAPEATAEATELFIPNMHEDWQVVQGQRMAFGVPNTFITADSSNPAFFDAVTRTVLGDGASGGMATILSQMSIDALAGGFTGDDIFLVAATYLESAFSTDLETTVVVLRGLLESTVGDSMEIELGESRAITLPAGDAIFIDGRILREGQPTLRNYSYILLSDDGKTTYNVSFSFLESRSEDQVPLAESIAQTITLIQEAAPVSAEATEVIIPNIPADWQVAQGQRTAFAVPANFIITDGDNQALLDATMGLVMGNSTEGEGVRTLFDQINIDILALQLQGSDLLFVSTVYQESPLSTDLETASGIVQGMFAMLSDTEDVEYTLLETAMVTLPVGEGLRSDSRLVITGRPAFRNIFYVMMRDDGLTMYALAFAFLDTEAEQQLPLVDAIAETFMVLESGN